MGTTEMAARQEMAAQAIPDKTLLDYLNTFTGQSALTETEQAQFLHIAKAYNLNPFKREIYAVAYGKDQNRKCSIITGYEAYIKRAEATGLLDGWEVSFNGSGENLTARITIHRKGWEKPFIHEAYYNESVQTRDGKPNQIWGKMPRTMLRKVAISQGFRLCFPTEIGGMPYAGEEIDAPEMRDVTPSGRQAAEPPAASGTAAQMAKDALENPPDKNILDLDEASKAKLDELAAIMNGNKEILNGEYRQIKNDCFDAVHGPKDKAADALQGLIEKRAIEREAAGEYA